MVTNNIFWLFSATVLNIILITSAINEYKTCEKGYFTPYVSRRALNDIIETKIAESSVDCKRACRLVKICYSFNYDTSSRECQLIHGVDTPAPATSTAKYHVSCPGDMVFDETVGSCYEKLVGKLYWQAAREACLDINSEAHLMEITTATEDTVIKAMRAGWDNAAWTAGYRLPGELVNETRWYTNEQLVSSTYTDWAANQPKAINGECVSVTTTGEWALRGCLTARYVLCEF